MSCSLDPESLIDQYYKVYQCVNPGCKYTIDSIREYTVCPACHSDMLELTRENFENPYK